MRALLVIVAAICSILGFVLGIFATRPGRSALFTAGRILRAPLLGPRLLRLGVYNFFESRHALARRRRTGEVYEYIKHAREEIGIIATSLQRSVVHQDLPGRLKDHLRREEQVRIRVFLLDPQSPVATRVAEATRRELDELRAAIEKSRARLVHMQSRCSPEQRERLSVHYYDAYIANSMLVVDPDRESGPLPGRSTSRFLVEHYMYDLAIDGRYSFEVRRRGSPMHEKLRHVYHRFVEDYGSA